MIKFFFCSQSHAGALAYINKARAYIRTHALKSENSPLSLGSEINESHVYTRGARQRNKGAREGTSVIFLSPRIFPGPFLASPIIRAAARTAHRGLIESRRRRRRRPSAKLADA